MRHGGLSTKGALEREKARGKGREAGGLSGQCRNNEERGVRAPPAEDSEPTLAELLDEPIIVMLMLRDGVERQDVEQLLRRVAELRLSMGGTGSGSAQALQRGPARFTVAA